MADGTPPVPINPWLRDRYAEMIRDRFQGAIRAQTRYLFLLLLISAYTLGVHFTPGDVVEVPFLGLKVPRQLVETSVAVRAGWKAGEIRSKQFRHTYATARLQTTDRGAPVAAWTVAKELGHTSTAMIESTYGHLGEVRHRSDVVEYRAAQHTTKLGDRLSRMFAVTSGKQEEGADGRVS